MLIALRLVYKSFNNDGRAADRPAPSHREMAGHTFKSLTFAKAGQRGLTLRGSLAVSYLDKKIHAQLSRRTLPKSGKDLVWDPHQRISENMSIILEGHC